MKFERQLKEEVSVNLTPLIDVVFLLLIFFMVTTTFSEDTRLVINLPEASGEMSETFPSQINIFILENGAYVVNGEQTPDNNLETLKQRITEISEGNNTLPLILTADANATHQAVVTAMDAVAQLGFSQLNIATREPQEN